MTDEAGSIFVLEFSFPVDLSATITVPDMVEIYQEVLAGTSIKDTYVRGMLPLWLYGHLKGDTRMEDAAFGPLRTEGVSFHRPWFSEWLEHFREARLLPAAWEPFADQVKDRRLGFRNEQVPLLAQTIRARIHNLRLARQHSALAEPPNRSRGRTYSYRLSSDCQAAQSLAVDRLARLVPGDVRTYPPYFPGDRTHVTRVPVGGN
jgi:hypothetical protein